MQTALENMSPTLENIAKSTKIIGHPLKTVERDHISCRFHNAYDAAGD